jgi:hypothetical protein
VKELQNREINHASRRFAPVRPVEMLHEVVATNLDPLHAANLRIAQTPHRETNFSCYGK